MSSCQGYPTQLVWSQLTCCPRAPGFLLAMSEGGKHREKISNTHISHMDEYMNGYARNLQHNNLKISYFQKILDLLKLPSCPISVGMPSSRLFSARRNSLRLLRAPNSVGIFPPMPFLERISLSVRITSKPKVK